ncbi:META domain-containing protein [Porphyromonas asaccharolytica]|uniref:DUF306 domain-containing protein n=1 Tax=Porphyromonas asaccharolytica (strain ATCC 25260 / DSM 20707 / BCRC 10618 / CCUG 7834 / JCM 6326 / LMG 13178 / VPI 4198 / B440) TaxID=879243 RepID=F4KJG6_PORAD|nr:META domain-containing protein [Porphyromonas asaccharolytica]AEE13588.1 protein of unknown function DUF306 Meta and HslJ [Porphyromonas asaccharolytica DSM 20707]
MKRIYFVALLLLTSLLCVSCGTCKNSSKINLASLDGSSWELTHMDGIEINKDAVQTATISISKARISGQAACNSYGGECMMYPDGRIKIGDMMSTRMACSNMMYERIFLAALQEAKAFRMDGANRLKIYSTHDASGQPSLTFKRK